MQVIDDESDYFSVDSNKWLTEDQRKALRKREDEIREKRHGSRLNRKITFDFAGAKSMALSVTRLMFHFSPGRRVVEDDTSNAEYDPSADKVVKAIMESDRDGDATNSSSVIDMGRQTLTDGDGVINPYINGPRPMVEQDQTDIDIVLSTDNVLFQLVDTARPPTQHRPSVAPDPAKASSAHRRLQDRELQEMGDEGLCMSMHQPYASLLVRGRDHLFFALPF